MEEIKTKRCSKCEEVKPVSEFGKKSAVKCGLIARCKECIKKDNAIQNFKRGKASTSAVLFSKLPLFKACSKCNILKPIDAYYKNKDASIGLNSQCKECGLVNQRDYISRNKNKRTDYLLENKERIQKWRRDNIDYHREYLKKRRKENPDRYNEYSRNQTERLSDSYVKKNLRAGYGIRSPSIEIIKLKRCIIGAKREMKQYRSMA